MTFVEAYLTGSGIAIYSLMVWFMIIKLLERGSKQK
jgi:hypothetical protein